MKELEKPLNCQKCEGMVCINQLFQKGRVKFRPKEIRMEILEESIINCPLRETEVEREADIINLGS